MDLAHQRSAQPSGVVEWLFNTVPPFVVGLTVYTWLSRFVCKRQPDGYSFGKHLRRSSPLYVIGVGVGVLVAHDAPRPDFWSLGQLVFWPWVATVAGIAADLLTTLRGRRKMSV